MPERFNLSLGGISISLVADQTSGEYVFHKREADFRSSDAPEISLQVHFDHFPRWRASAVRTVFETNVSWQLFTVRGNNVIKTGSSARHNQRIGVFTPDFRNGDIYVSHQLKNPDHYIFPLSYPLGEVYLMNLLASNSGLLTHAAGVIAQGNGYLFSGHGGAGKSTTARLWQEQAGVQVVNDDKVILRKQGGKFILYGTPWHGQGGIAIPACAPLKRIFILKQAPSNAVTALSPAQAASRILARSFVPLWDNTKMASILNFLEELCQAVPCQELGFVPDPSAVDFVRNLP